MRCAQGLLEGPSGCGIVRISEVVQETLKLDMCASMIGANVASEIARGLFSEGTIGCRDLARGLEIKRLLEVRTTHTHTRTRTHMRCGHTVQLPVARRSSSSFSFPSSSPSASSPRLASPRVHPHARTHARTPTYEHELSL